MKATRVILAMAIILIAGSVFAQTPGLMFDFKLGQDNAWLFTPGKQSSYLAVGGGVDIISYTKKLSPTGGVLALYLHGSLLTPVTGNLKKPIFGLSVNCDAIQLLTGSPLKILIQNLSLLAGPIIAYDSGQGEMAYGGIVNLNYKF